MGQEFQLTNIKSKAYNYTVDYFELRAQPGRAGEEFTSDFWYRDVTDGLLYPLFVDDRLIIGGTAPVSDEILRVNGAINTLEIRFGDSYIKDNLGSLTFHDTKFGTATLEDLMWGFWSRDAINGFLYSSHITDSLLLGQSTGDVFKRLQIKSELNDNTSYYIFGKDSVGADRFFVTDQGDIKGRSIYFGLNSNSSYIVSNIGNDLEFHSDAQLLGTWSSDGLSSVSSWLLQNNGVAYSKVGSSGDGFGFPAIDQLGLYINGSSLYNFSANKFSFPQQAWIYSGMNLLRINNASQIELNTFLFDPSESKFYLNADTYIYPDVIGNLTFYDKALDYEITLTELASMIKIYWEKDPMTNDVLLRFPEDHILIPEFAGSTIRSIFTDLNGRLFADELINTFTQNITVSLSSGKTLGKYTSGQTIPSIGRTIQQVLIDIANEYINSRFVYFVLSGQSNTVEVGTTISGTRSFDWSINVGTGQVNTIDIYDITDDSILISNTPNDGSQSISLNTIQLNSENVIQQWKGVGVDSLENPIYFDSNLFTVTAKYYRFYGPSASSVTNNSTIRTLQSLAFHNAGTFVLNTGNTLLKFIVCLPPGKTISSVIDLEVNANITSEYIQLADINVLDAGGTNRAYHVYEMNLSLPYSSSHRHSITTS